MKDKKGLFDQMKIFLIWGAIAFALFFVFSSSRTSPDTRGATQLEYSEFIEKVTQGEVKTAKITNKRQNKLVTGTLADGKRYSVETPNDNWMISDLIKNKVKTAAEPEEEPSLLTSILVSWGPMLLLIGVWVWFMRSQAGGRGGANPFSFGKSRARLMEQDEQKAITFADVAGCDEAKMDVEEIVEFLRDPTRFQKLGGKIPKGVLMVGPPGTGKTLLAKAIAGEAKVPFFAISGSDFVEMFVGVGASRVRDMFAEAKKNAPCIIFIDEIDAVGRHRGAGIGGGNDEREQTLNQMLVEMDGFEGSSGIIIIGATNRPDVLDPALLRPGRLDRQVVVGLPDIRGREQILAVHTRKVPVSTNVTLRVIARGTPGFSGADLANLVNEAALFAARRDKKFVEMDDFELAKDKILMGAERRSILMPEHERLNTAYHESGHAVVARMLPGTDPVHKVTIIPRGRALGVTMQLPEQDRYSHNKAYLLNQIAILYGGRLAEEIFVNDMTTGASNDFQRATDLARRMVCEWGMSDMGIMVYGEEEGEVFLGRSVTRHKSLSEATQKRIDDTIGEILAGQYEVAKQILLAHKPQVEAMTKALMEIETIEQDQIDDIMNLRDIRNYDARRAEADARKAKIEQVKGAAAPTPDLPPDLPPAAA